MQQLLFKSRENERGIIIVMFAIVITAVLSVLAMAVDAGNLYKAQLAVQNAADASALAGIVHIINLSSNGIPEENIYALSGVNPGDNPSTRDLEISKYLNAITKEIAIQNLEAAGYPNGHKKPGLPDGDYEINFNGVYRAAGAGASDGAVHEYEVNITKKIDFFIADLIPNFSTNDVVGAHAKSRRNKARVVVILDHSHSMGCPVEGDCACLSDPNGGECGGKAKTEDLVQAAGDFYTMFDVVNDEIIAVPFNTIATQINITEWVNDLNLNPNDIPLFGQRAAADLLAQYPAEGLTNMSDAFVQAIGAIRDMTNGSEESVSVVGFFDGGATAMRALFSDPNSLAPYPAGGTNRDYIHYTMEWLQPNGLLNSGPGVLVHYDAFDMGYIDPFPPADAAGNMPVPSCGPEFPPTVPPMSLADAAAEVFNSPAGDGCLNSLEGHMPGDPTITYGTNYGKNDPNCPTCPMKGFENYPEQYYNSTIELADYIREKLNGIVYIVGLGPINPFLAALAADPGADRATLAAALNVPMVDPNDEYENIFDTFYLKRTFLNRLALDFETYENYPNEFNYSGYQGYAGWLASNPEKGGVFLPTSDPGELRQLFRQIARKILLQLIE